MVGSAGLALSLTAVPALAAPAEVTKTAECEPLEDETTVCIETQTVAEPENTVFHIEQRSTATVAGGTDQGIGNRTSHGVAAGAQDHGSVRVTAEFPGGECKIRNTAHYVSDVELESRTLSRESCE